MQKPVPPLVVTRRRAMQQMTGLIVPSILVAVPSWATAAEQSFTCDVPGKGWLRIAYAINEVSDYHQFILSVWASYRSHGSDAERNILNLGPFKRSMRVATKPMKIAPTRLRVSIAGTGFEYRVQAQYKPENGNAYTNLGEEVGTF